MNTKHQKFQKSTHSQRHGRLNDMSKRREYVKFARLWRLKKKGILIDATKQHQRQRQQARQPSQLSYDYKAAFDPLLSIYMQSNKAKR
jgi:hypothetical protein